MARATVFWLSLILASACGGDPLPATQPDANLREAALHTLKKAASYYRTKVASHGGYVYYYSVDLQQRWGEGKASLDTIFVPFR